MSKKGRITTDELKQHLKPYFDAGILTETLYTSDFFSIFIYANLSYAVFPNILFDDEYPIGMLTTPEYAEEYITNPYLFKQHFNNKLDTGLKRMLHFSSENVVKYLDIVDRLKETHTGSIDEKVNQRIKLKNVTHPLTSESLPSSCLYTVVALIIFFVLMSAFSQGLSSIFSFLTS